MIPQTEIVPDDFLMTMGFLYNSHLDLWILDSTLGRFELKSQITYEEFAKELNEILVGVFEYGKKTGRNEIRETFKKLLNTEY